MSMVKVLNIGWVHNTGYVNIFIGKCCKLTNVCVTTSSVVGHYAIQFPACLLYTSRCV